MAERRMFAKTIIDSDAFLEMPASSQMLYFHLAMRADDEGFVNNPKRIQKMVGASDDDMKVLIAKRFILVFESGVIVIKHWKIHNYIQKDRYKPTVYAEERKQLKVKSDGAYTEVDTKCIQNGYRLDTQVSIGKDRLGKDSIGEDRLEVKDDSKSKKIEGVNKAEPSTRKPYGSFKNVFLTDDELQRIKTELPDNWEARIEKVSLYCGKTHKVYPDYCATVIAWAKEDAEKQKNAPALYPSNNRPGIRGNFDQRVYDDDFFESLYDDKRIAKESKENQIS